MWPALAAEFKLRSRTHVPPTNLKQIVGLVSQVYGAWCGAHLRNTETRQRQQQRQRRRAHTYQLAFRAVHNDETLLDIAEYCTFFETADTTTN
jgi:hypothetical protein